LKGLPESKTDHNKPIPLKKSEFKDNLN